ncbi:MAG TPA: FAD-dependent oxidoreductase [Pirellulales bacterium]|nr:FAD-dependent oxidoreductase [Pirellulales bacterium]
MTTAVSSPIYRTQLQSHQEVAEQTMAFRFDKPAGFTFTPGQFIDITLLDPPETDAEGNARGFSLASAPYEDFLMVATRTRDTAFKRVLGKLAPGVEVKIEGPFGDLRLHHDPSRAAVVLTGGIGITPFRSILLQATRDKLPQRIFLFYGNRRPEDAAFLAELQALEKQNPNYKLIACMSEMEKSQRPWAGERGEIDSPMLARHLPGVGSAIYYITGPPAMVKAMHAVLKDTGVDDDNIRIEEFAGY